MVDALRFEHVLSAELFDQRPQLADRVVLVALAPLLQNAHRLALARLRDVLNHLPQ